MPKREEEPECTCTQVDVDRWDARGCEEHDPNSPFNVRLRALEYYKKKAAAQKAGRRKARR